jgi:hypothetical protein
MTKKLKAKKLEGCISEIWFSLLFYALQMVIKMLEIKFRGGCFAPL